MWTLHFLFKEGHVYYVENTPPLHTGLRVAHCEGKCRLFDVHFPFVHFKGAMSCYRQPYLCSPSLREVIVRPSWS